MGCVLVLILKVKNHKQLNSRKKLNIHKNTTTGIINIDVITFSRGLRAESQI